MKYCLFLLPLVILFFSCEQEQEPKPAPVASFIRVSPSTFAAAKKTNVVFENTSTGDFDFLEWDFEDGLYKTNLENPTYQFKCEGTQPVSLTVSGPGGSTTITWYFVVFGMEDCFNFNSKSTYIDDYIEELKDNNSINEGSIFIRNDYSEPIEIMIFSPDEWLDCKYNGTHLYNFPANFNANLNVDGQFYKKFSNDWGIRVEKASGTLSCVRLVGSISSYNGSRYDIKASQILEGQ